MDKLPLLVVMLWSIGVESMSLVQVRTKVAKSNTFDDVCDRPLTMLRQTANNLGGLGPVLTDPPYMLFEDVLPNSGKTVHLKISNITEYKQKTSEVNGKYFSFTQINIASGTETEFLFAFVEEKNGDYLPVKVDPFAVTFFDFDTGKLGTASESISIEPVKDHIVANDTELAMVSFSGGRVTYKATEWGNYGDNPKHPFTLTPQNKRRTLTVTVPGETSQFVVNLKSTPAKNNKPGGRNFLFSGPSSMVCEPQQTCAEFDCDAHQLAVIAKAEYFVGDLDACCTEKAACSTHTCSANTVLRMGAANLKCSGHTCETKDDAVCCEKETALCERALDLTRVTENNLGGQGPQTDAPGKTITFSNVFPKISTPVDLVITALSPYVAKNENQNGNKGSLGCVNVLSGTSVNLRYTFVDQVTREPKKVPGFYWSIYDFDTGAKGWGTESVAVKGHATYFVTPSSELLVEGPVGSEVFYGTTKGTETDNPTDLLSLTERQLDRAVTFRFTPSSSFEVTFGASASKPGKSGGRNIMFAGTSALKCAKK